MLAFLTGGSNFSMRFLTYCHFSHTHPHWYLYFIFHVQLFTSVLLGKALKTVLILRRFRSIFYYDSWIPNCILLELSKSSTIQFAIASILLFSIHSQIIFASLRHVKSFTWRFLNDASTLPPPQPTAPPTITTATTNVAAITAATAALAAAAFLPLFAHVSLVLITLLALRSYRFSVYSRPIIYLVCRGLFSMGCYVVYCIHFMPVYNIY